jgi:hypothetical protein
MAKTSKSKANTTKAAERNSGKTKRAIIKDLQPTAKAGQKVVGGMLGQRES